MRPRDPTERHVSYWGRWGPRRPATPALTHTQDTTAPGCLSQGVTRSGTQGKDGPPRAHWATADFCEVPGSPAQLPGRPGSGPTHSRSGPAEKHSGTGVWLADPQGPQGQNNCPTACTQERPAFFPGLSPDGRHESRGPRTWELLERGGDQDAPPCNTHISLKE